MNTKRISIIIIFQIFCISTIFATDYSRYRYEQFTTSRGNPAYLMVYGGAGSLVRIEGNRWVIPLGPFWYITLSQNQIDIINRTINNNDNFILFFQRRGNYVDISRFTGTNNPNQIRRDTQGQIDFIEATVRTYSFVADEILPYSEIMVGVSREIQRILLNEENRNEENGGLRIFHAFINGQINGARNYINSRISEIESTNARMQVEIAEEAQRQAAEEQRRLDEIRVAEHRAFTLENASILGYKPCFNIEGSNNQTPYERHEKILVVGYIENRYNSFGDEFRIMPINFNNNQRGMLELIRSTSLRNITNIFPNISKSGSSGSFNSYYCIFFITKNLENGISRYNLDSFIYLGDIIGKTRETTVRADVQQRSLEEWILNNLEQQNLPNHNIITTVLDNNTNNQSSTPVVMPNNQIIQTQKTVSGGYIPCFNIDGTPNPTPFRDYSKIAVIGYFNNTNDNNFQIRTYNYNRNQRANIIISVSQENRDIFRRIVRQGYTSDSYFCIFFLTKQSNGSYNIDNFIDYGEIIGKNKNNVFANDIDRIVLERWIDQNQD